MDYPITCVFPASMLNFTSQDEVAQAIKNGGWHMEILPVEDSKPALKVIERQFEQWRANRQK